VKDEGMTLDFQNPVRLLKISEEKTTFFISG
jgi:hypothetical protein